MRIHSAAARWPLDSAALRRLSVASTAAIAVPCSTVFSLPNQSAPNFAPVDSTMPAQPRDEHLAADDHRHHPRAERRRRRTGHQVDERPADEHLVGERVEAAADGGERAVPPRPPAVEPVGQRGDGEHGQARPATTRG